MIDEEEIIQPEEKEEEEPVEDEPEEEEQPEERRDDRGRKRKKKRRQKPKDQDQPTKEKTGEPKPSPSESPEIKSSPEAKPSSGVSPDVKPIKTGSPDGGASGAKTISPSEVPSTPARTPSSIPKSESIPSSSLGGASAANIGKTAMAGGEQAKQLASQGLNIGWNGMKAAMSPFMDDETKERLQNIENNVRGGVEGINRAINAPREIAERVHDIVTLPKRVSDAIKLAQELPQRIQQVQQMLQNAKNVPDVVNAYNTLMSGSQSAGVAGGTTAGGAVGTATTATGAGAGGATVVATTAATVATTTVVVPVVAETGVVVGTAAGGAAAGTAAGVAVTLPVWVIVLIIVLVIALVVAIALICAGGKNNINSLAGGSAIVGMKFDGEEHKILVDRLIQKTTGCDPMLVVYDQGKGDIEWQQTEDGSKYFNSLDKRLLKTIDYLTDRHRIKIGLLQTGSPKLLQNDTLTGLAQYRNPNAINDGSLPSNWDDMTADEQREYFDTVLTPEERQNSEIVESTQTISAFSLGQAMAIIEIDRSRIPALQLSGGVNECGQIRAAPIEVSWQKTQSENTVRVTWEELSWIAGQIDQLIPYFEALYNDSSGGRVDAVATSYRLSLIDYNGSGVQTSESIISLFSNIKRATELLQRVNSWGYFSMNADTLSHASRALVNLEELNNHMGLADPLSSTEAETISDADLADLIKSYGSPEMIKIIHDGVSNIYKMTQVANMVGWDFGTLSYQKAYESRNKIREIIVELLQMPTKVDLYSDTADTSAPDYFDEAMVPKQIVTFSPEDDLDNGPENIDVFPFGVDGVGVDGISMDNSGADGEYTYEDQHFSHPPIDNGVFSKSFTSFVFNDDTNPLIPEIINQFAVSWDKVVHRYLWNIGGGVPPTDGDKTVTVSYQKFLFVAF